MLDIFIQSIMDATKSVIAFLQKNDLLNTLAALRGDLKRTLNADNNLNLQCQVPPQVANLKINFEDKQVQHKLRNHLQTTDSKYLRKFVERLKRSSHKLCMKKDCNRQKGRTIQPLTEMKFFKKLMEKQNTYYNQYREQIHNEDSFMQESVQFQNEWENDQDQGFKIYECPTQQFGRMCKEMVKIRTQQEIPIKNIAFPEIYYQKQKQAHQKVSVNIHDQLPTSLPPTVKFNFQSTFYHMEETHQDYPLQANGVVFDTFNLKIIYDRQKTGFQQERDMMIVINEVLAGKFQIISVLGQAQFSKAIEVRDLINQKHYCLKIIKNNKDYLDQSIDQIKLLTYIKANCDPDEHYLLNLYDYFYHKEHLMLVTELLKDNLYDAYSIHPEYFTLRTVQIFTRQILLALQKLHELHVIHCDLKPENILIKSYTNRLIKVIDVGSSVFLHDQPMFYVQTRCYRAPEVILGCSYDQKIDIWSLGCIIAEILTGQVLFDSETKPGLLAKIQGLRGPWPSWMIQKGKYVSKYFTKDMIIYQDIYENQSKEQRHKKTGMMRIYRPKMTNMRARVNSENKKLLDFLSKCLKIDPVTRISAEEALKHPFMKETIQQ